MGFVKKHTTWTYMERGWCGNNNIDHLWMVGKGISKRVSSLRKFSTIGVIWFTGCVPILTLPFSCVTYSKFGAIFDTNKYDAVSFECCSFRRLFFLSMFLLSVSMVDWDLPLLLFDAWRCQWQKWESIKKGLSCCIYYNWCPRVKDNMHVTLGPTFIIQLLVIFFFIISY